MHTLLALAFLASATPSAAAADRRPNILFIFADDHAYQAISAYGSGLNETPNIDRLAREGMLFRNAFCTNSICAPSRAVVLTGKHNHLNGVVTNGVTFDGEQETVPKLMRALGYQTAIIGKWHLRSRPTGFDHYEVLIGQGPYYNPTLRTEDGDVPHEGYTTEILTERALAWLDEARDPDRPFFLMWHHKAPHRNWQPGPRQLGMYDDTVFPEPETLFDDYSGRASPARTQEMEVGRDLTPADLKLVPPPGLTEEQSTRWHRAFDPRKAELEEQGLEGDALVRWKFQAYMRDYLACISAVDDGLGRVLDRLDETGLAANTVVIYSSDQGFYLGEHGWFDKRWMYEESLRMPLLVRWPGVTAPGSECRAMVQNLDFAETFLAIAGAEAPAAMQGASLVPLLSGETAPGWRRSLYYHYLEFPGAHSVRPHFGVRTERYKLIRYYQSDEWELFDLEQDPHELTSVYEDPLYAVVRGELTTELARLQAEAGDHEATAPARRFVQGPLRERAAQVPAELALSLAEIDDTERVDLDPAAKPLSIAATVTPAGIFGVVAAQGGTSFGYTLYLDAGVPHFAVRSDGELVEVAGTEPLEEGTGVRLEGILDATGTLILEVGGRPVARAPGLLLASKPAEGLTLGRDGGSPVGPYESPAPFPGTIRDLTLRFGPLEP